MGKSIWKHTRIDYDFGPLAESLGISPQLAEIMVKRGINTPDKMRAFLNPSMEQMHAPELLKDMEKGCEILEWAVNEKKKIRVIGDYDVDGVMSTTILLKGLTRLGAEVDARIPDRIKDGYGIRTYMVEEAFEDGCQVILTCDNGISAGEAVKRGKDLGMKIVLTDHHEIPFQENQGEKTYVVPPADAVIDPKQEECTYPFKEICGAVVAYKLMQEMYNRAGKNISAEKDLLVFAAIATVCDVMPLIEENRAIVALGLRDVHHTKNPGLDSLLKVKNLQDKPVSAYHFAFIIGPCINAAGRIDTAKKSLEMFMAEKDTDNMAVELSELNDERKALTASMEEIAFKLVEQGELKNDKVLLVYLPECHESIAGIVAGHIREKYYRPALVAVKGEKCVKGSGRSIPEYSMYEELNRAKEYFLEFGGHPLAAGFSLEEENVEPLRKRLNELTTLSDEDLTEKIYFDLLMSLSRTSLSLLNDLERIEPSGQKNARPLFAATGLEICEMALLGENKTVLRIKVREQDENKLYTVMDFDGGKKLREVLEEKYGKGCFEAVLAGKKGCKVDMLYKLRKNEYNGGVYLQIQAQHYR